MTADKNSTLRLFADDSIIYREVNTIDDAKLLQSDLEAAGRWEQDWLMHFHPDKRKTQLISMTTYSKKLNLLNI